MGVPDVQDAMAVAEIMLDNHVCPCGFYSMSPCIVDDCRNVKWDAMRPSMSHRMCHVESMQLHVEDLLVADVACMRDLV